MLQCDDCNLRRLLYACRKPTKKEQTYHQIAISDVSLTCEAQHQDLNLSGQLNEVYTRKTAWTERVVLQMFLIVRMPNILNALTEVTRIPLIVKAYRDIKLCNYLSFSRDSSNSFDAVAKEYVHRHYKISQTNNDIMAKSTHPHPHLDLSRTRNQTTIWIGLICVQRATYQETLLLAASFFVCLFFRPYLFEKLLLRFFPQQYGSVGQQKNNKIK